MFQTPEDFLKLPDQDLKTIISLFTISEISIASHGFSPDLKNRISKNFSLLKKIKLWIAPERKMSFPLSDIEKIHEKIIEKANQFYKK